jgi:mandelate racemase
VLAFVSSEASAGFHISRTTGFSLMMSKAVPAIRSVKARALVVPLTRPVKNAFGVIDVGPLVLIDVETDQGVTGHAYIFAYAKLTLKPLVHLIEEIGRELTGKPVAPYDLMAAMDAKLRLLGWQGLVGMAVSGLDMAYWDALGQIAGRPLAELLGGSPRPIKAYDSYGVVDPTADEKALRRSLDQGFRGIKIKGGDGDAANDERVVRGVRALLGPDIALMIDFNQSLDPAEATRRIALLAPYDLHWIEEPVPQENLSGHAKVRETSPTPIQAGENWWFPRGFAEAIAAGASDFIMPDLMKVGGVTGWLQVAGQADAASIPMSSHLFAEASAHMLAVTPTAHWLELLDFAVPSSPTPSKSSTGPSPHAGRALGCNGMKPRLRNTWWGSASLYERVQR